LGLDLEFENETSGCTAIVALLTKDDTLYVVSTVGALICFFLNSYCLRVMQVILELLYVQMGLVLLYQKIINLQTQKKPNVYTMQADMLNLDVLMVKKQKTSRN
jgi:hypothetical protein